MWENQKGRTACPACGEVGCFGLHARYEKYHLEVRIPIRRVRCKPCGTTHALIPLFSVPQTSWDTQQVEDYYLAREQGASRAEASEAIRARGWESRIGKRLERRLEVAVRRAKAIWAKTADAALSPLSWILAVCGPTPRPVVAMNAFALEAGVNAILFCRSSILFFRPRHRKQDLSHKPVSAGPPVPPGRMAAIPSDSGGP